jgi:hypothetical protein
MGCNSSKDTSTVDGTAKPADNEAETKETQGAEGEHEENPAGDSTT